MCDNRLRLAVVDSHRGILQPVRRVLGLLELPDLAGVALTGHEAVTVLQMLGEAEVLVVPAECRTWNHEKLDALLDQALEPLDRLLVVLRRKLDGLVSLETREIPDIPARDRDSATSRQQTRDHARRERLTELEDDRCFVLVGRRPIALAQMDGEPRVVVEPPERNTGEHQVF